MVRRTSCWGSLTGRSRSRTWSRRVKMAVLAPMPRARVRTATAVKPGVRASMRKEYFKSRRTVSSQPMKFIRRGPSLPILVTGDPGQLEVKTKKFAKSLIKVRKDSWILEIVFGEVKTKVSREYGQSSQRTRSSRRWLWLPYERPGFRLFAERKRRRGR